MSEAAVITLNTSLREVKGLSAITLKMLEKESILSVDDLLTCFPSRHEDRRRMEFKGFSPSETPVCHHVTVLKTRLLRFGGRGGVFEAVVEGAEGNPMHQQLTLRWFNMVFMQRSLAAGMELIVYGKIKEVKARMVMDHPEYEIVRGEDDEEAGIHSGRIVPVYRLRGGLKQKPLRVALWRLMEALTQGTVPDILPAPKKDGEFAAMSRLKALRIIHRPAEMSELEGAKRYLALEEFYLMQLRVVRRKLHFKHHGGWSQRPAGRLTEAFLKSLPFSLTGAQARCLEEIREDMASPQPMNRLLHGDVGSGKTVVALAAMLVAVESGQQAAMMAPTQILAEQHYAKALEWLEPLGIRVALQTGDRKADSGGMELFGGGKVKPAREATLQPMELKSLGSARILRAASGILPEAQERVQGLTGAAYSKRYLPHFERPWAKYMVTYSTRERWVLSNSARDIVLKALLYFNNVRYHLFAVVIMPDHVHMLLEPLPESWLEDGTPVFHSLGDIDHSIKSYTAKLINTAEKRKGVVWEKESFDRLIRSESDLQEKFLYIIGNAHQAGIVGEGESYPWCWTPQGVPQDAEHSTQDACAPLYNRSGEASGTGERSPGFLDAARNATPPSPEKSAGHPHSPLPIPDHGLPHILIGTHALLYNDEALSHLGLVVIDEQHKFGVAQRARLISRGKAPDVLVMTATPIPRTLTLTLYGDLDVSTIDQRPKARGKIVTAVRTPKKVKEVTSFVLTQLEEGRQCYIVYPLIDESEKLDASAATTGYEEWAKKLAPHATGLLHGRMDSAMKDSVMRQFRSGEIKALVSTTVIEVGVDVPNATVMLIHDAARFGLAQLHQLRGRIGRGSFNSYCVLQIAEKDEEAKARLKIMEETTDGFVIAEEDLKRRGPGDVLGKAQSGQSPLRFGELLADTRLVTLARRLAERTLHTDLELELPAHAHFRGFVLESEVPVATMQ